MSERRFDLLLQWVSEKGRGTWAEFREAWDWLLTLDGQRAGHDLGDKAWVAAASLAALAHIELSWDGQGEWAAAPPVITMLPNSGGRALLTGARTRALYLPGAEPGASTGRVADAAADIGLWIDDVPQEQGPASVLVACNEAGDAERLAAACGISYSYSVSDQLAAMLPPLESYFALWPSGELPEGFPVDRFDAEALSWEPCEREDADTPGLYRAKTYRQHVDVLVTATGASLRVSREQAVFEVLRWAETRVLEYDEARRELWVPVGAALPLIHGRAAVLCSGQLPRYQRRWGMHGRTYVNVKPAVAGRILTSLCQAPS